MTCAAMTSTQVLLPARKDAPYDPASDFLAVLRSAVTTIEAALADGDWDADRETGAAIGRTLSFLRRTPGGVFGLRQDLASITAHADDLAAIASQAIEFGDWKVRPSERALIDRIIFLAGIVSGPALVAAA